MSMRRRDFTVWKDKGVYPPGVTKIEKGVHFSCVSPGKECRVLLYEQGEEEPCRTIAFPEEERLGDVWNVSVSGDFRGLEYVYETDRGPLEEPFGRQYSGWETWGENGKVHRAAVWPEEREFDWEGDQNPGTPYEDTVLYHLHVRGFTRHSSSKVPASARGTFRGIIEKIPYLKELGVTAVELMPPVEFQEVLTEEPLKVNYWGYQAGFSMAPKSSYCSGRKKTPVREFKTLVKELHRAGLELIVELFFTGEEYPPDALRIIHYWIREFHVDGVHLIGYGPVKLLAADPLVSRVKLLASDWGETESRNPYLAEYNDRFMLEMRSCLKGDPDQMSRLAWHTRSHPGQRAVIQYMANENTFTLMDTVSYSEKHNQANGENNADGPEENQSWNCGAEGPTRKKQILQLRQKQIRNALLLLILSQGTPMLLAGDEMGRTKKGNNNSYCQDNETSWLNWKLSDSQRQILEFVKQAIAFRKKHPVFHQKQKVRLTDYSAVGMPDVSYHGTTAWRPDFGRDSRSLGILYCGEYSQKDKDVRDDYFYVAYNLYWEPGDFALPCLPKGLFWHRAADTSLVDHNGFLPEGREELLADQRKLTTEGRTIVILIGKEKANVKSR